MDRWTQEELQRTDNIEFAICIMNERRNRLNPYSPLSMKLGASIKILSEIRDERTVYLNRLSKVDIGEPEDNVTDLSDCDEETKRTILENAEKLEKAEENEAVKEGSKSPDEVDTGEPL